MSSSTLISQAFQADSALPTDEKMLGRISDSNGGRRLAGRGQEIGRFLPLSDHPSQAKTPFLHDGKCPRLNDARNSLRS